MAKRKAVEQAQTAWVAHMVRMQPRIRFKGMEYFLDEDRMELRPVRATFKSIPIDDCDVCLIKHTCQYV